MIKASKSKWLSDKVVLFNGPIDFENLSDKDLYAYCKKVGFNARTWSRLFIAAIPEVSKRRLYKKYGYCSIHEFAAKMAGISHANTDEVLRVSEKFKELPKMKELIGEVGLSKLRVVACVVNKENECELAEKVKNLTKSSLEIYIREIAGNKGRNRHQNLETPVFSLPGEEFRGLESGQISQGQEQIGLFENVTNLDQKVENLQNHDKKSFTIQIDEETEFELRKFKQKLEKERKEPVDWNFALKEMIKRANGEQKVLPNKTKECAVTSGAQIKKSGNEQAIVSRYIPAKIKHDLKEKYHGHCAYKCCNKPAEQIHHSDRFAIKSNHENLIPLCKIHHDFVHQNSKEPQKMMLDKIFNNYKMKYLDYLD